MLNRRKLRKCIPSKYTRYMVYAWDHLDVGRQEVRVCIKVNQSDGVERESPAAYSPVE